MKCNTGAPKVQFLLSFIFPYPFTAKLLKCEICFNNKSSVFSPQSVIVRFVPFSKSTAIISLHIINRRAFVMERGTRWRSWLKHYATSRKVASSIPDSVTEIFHWHTRNGSGRTTALGLTQLLTEMSKRQINPITGLGRPWGFQNIEAPRYQDDRHMKVVRLSTIRTGCLYPQELFLVLICVQVRSGAVGWGTRLQAGRCLRIKLNVFRPV
jgi:hypothetical protein